MKIRRGFKYRLKPTNEQRQRFVGQAGACRFVYNKILAINDARYDGARFNLNTPRINYHDSASYLKLWKQSEEYGWLKETDSQVLQQALKDLERAYINLFKGLTDPPTKRKKFFNDSFRYPQRFKVDRNNVYLPKIGWVEFKKHRPIIGEIKNVTVSLKGEHWFVSFQTEYEIDNPIHPSYTPVGIDMGIAQFATLSTGEHFEPLNSFRKQAEKLAKEQRKLAFQVKFSNRWKKRKATINRLHTKIADCRHDYLHKVSREISKNHAVVVLEDLKVSNMSKSASGTVEQPGRRVAQKSGLNKSILDQGWGMFRTMLAYKQAWAGGMVIEVPPQHTSQTCAECGCVDKASRPTQELFSCVHCGHTDNADVNAARVILAVGLTDSLNARLGEKSSSEAQVL